MSFETKDLVLSFKARESGSPALALLEECKEASKDLIVVAKADVECGRTPAGPARIQIEDTSLEVLKSALQKLINPA